jgi:hypothetical protein
MSHAVLARGWQITAAFFRIVCTVFFSFYKFFPSSFLMQQVEVKVSVVDV